MNKIKIKIEEIVFFSSIFLPLIGGGFTKTDVSIIPLLFALFIIFKNHFSILKDSTILILIFGASQIILNSIILNNFFSIAMIKGILILISPSIIYFTCKYLILKKNIILLFKNLINFTLIFNLLLIIFPKINYFLSNLLFLNRIKIGILINDGRGDLNIFGEPSFRAIFIAGIAMIIINLKDTIYKNKIKYYFDLILSFFLIFATKSATSIPVILIVFFFLIISIIEENKKLFTTKKIFYSFATLSAISLIVTRAINSEYKRINLFLNFFVLFQENPSLLAEKISLDASIMNRILNYDLFIRNFPFNIDYFFGISIIDYADISFNHASKYLLGQINYDTLVDLTSGVNFFEVQTTAIPSFFFNYGTLPTFLLILTLLLICIELVKLNQKFSTIPVILYLVFSLFMGPSILFSIPYIVILTLIYKSNTVCEYKKFNE